VIANTDAVTFALPHRYVLDGLLADARAGRRVLYVGSSALGARAVFAALIDHIGQRTPNRSTERVWRTHGAERIETITGGSVVFVPPTTAVRGREADVVYIDPGVESDAVLEEVAPTVAATGGEVIRGWWP
jgi:hypothetical protein